MAQRVRALHLQPGLIQMVVAVLLRHAATKLWNTARWEVNTRLQAQRDAGVEQPTWPSAVNLQKVLQSNRWYDNLQSDSATAVIQDLSKARRSYLALRAKDPTARPPGFRKKWSLSSVPFKARGFDVRAENDGRDCAGNVRKHPWMR